MKYLQFTVHRQNDYFTVSITDCCRLAVNRAACALWKISTDRAMLVCTNRLSVLSLYSILYIIVHLMYKYKSNF